VVGLKSTSCANAKQWAAPGLRHSGVAASHAADSLRTGMVTGNTFGLNASNFGNAFTYGTNSVSGNKQNNSLVGWSVINRQ
jgi:hypothetical protein